MQQTATEMKTTFDSTLEVGGWILLAVLWVMSLLVYQQVPDPAPIHFSFSGVITKWGHKVTLLFFPATATVIGTGLTLLCKHPSLFAPEADNRQLFYCRRLFRWFKLSISVVFSLVLVLIYQSSLLEPVGYKQLVFPTVIAIVGLPATYYIYRILSIKKTA